MDALAPADGLRLRLGDMHAAGVYLFNVLIVLFFVGLAGSAVVVLITFVEDFRELFSDNDHTATAPPTPPPVTSTQVKL